MAEEIKYHPKALAEAFRSARYYNRQEEGLGAEFFNAVDFCVGQLRQDPLRQKPDEDGVRSWRLRRFPFRVYYAVDPNRIRILAVAHLKRRPGYWRQRLEE
jgi:mRNA-degrading endonuclease RelE of RelBE toxin-antitoxin system